MVDLSPIAAVISSIGTAKELAKTAIEIRDAALLQSKIIELNDAILSAQSSALDAQSDQHSLTLRIEELQRQIDDFETWEIQKERYSLTDFGGGTFAYELKPDLDDEVPHKACPNCFESKRRSVLQFKQKTARQQDRFVCPACKTEFDFGVRGSPPQRAVRTGRPGRRGWME